MMIDTERVRDRFNNLREVQKDLNLTEISATFTEREIKEILWILGDYMSLIQAERSDGIDQERKKPLRDE